MVEISAARQDICNKFGHNCIFKYVPTELNPADMLTRGITHRDFCSKFEFWIHGPDFLWTPEVQWPVRNLGCLSKENQTLACANVVEQVEDSSLFSVQKYSDVHKLFRVTAYVYKFINKLRKSVNVDAENQAKIYWIKNEQRKYFSSEIGYLENNHDQFIPKLVSNLNLFLDSDGLLRSKGRLDKCLQFNYDVRNPLMLPRDSFLTELIVWDNHGRCMHLGTPSTLNMIRTSGYWITKGRATVKSILAKCIACKKINSLAFKYPKPTDYYGDKVNIIKPFYNTGIDFTGHFNVKLGD